MASLVNSVRTLMGDPWWAVKIAFLSAVLFYVMYNSYDYSYDEQSLMVIYASLGVLILGCISVSINRNINNKTPLLPSFLNIPEVIVKSICSLIAILPGALIFYGCIYLVQTNLELETLVMNIIYACITLFFLPFIIIPVVLYSVNGSLKDAFNLNIIFQASGNYVVQFLSYLVQYVLILFLFTLLIYFVLLEMFGDNVSLLVLKCILIIVSLFSLFIFSSDLYGDVIPEIRKKKKIKSKHSETKKDKF